MKEGLRDDGIEGLKAVKIARPTGCRNSSDVAGAVTRHPVVSLALRSSAEAGFAPERQPERTPFRRPCPWLQERVGLHRTKGPIDQGTKGRRRSF